MAEDSKVIINVNSGDLDTLKSADSPEDIANMIDKMMLSGTSRLKINISEELEQGNITKQYHHGRCDINSPFACGSVFDLLDE